MGRNKFSIRKDDWEKFQKNNVTIALNVFYPKKDKIYSVSVSKHKNLMGNKLFFE